MTNYERANLLHQCAVLRSQLRDLKRKGVKSIGEEIVIDLDTFAKMYKASEVSTEAMKDGTKKLIADYAGIPVVAYERW